MSPANAPLPPPAAPTIPTTKPPATDQPPISLSNTTGLSTAQPPPSSLPQVSPNLHPTPLHAENAAVERALRDQVAHAESLVLVLDAENRQLNQALAKERAEAAELRVQLRARLDFSEKLSRLISVFRALNIQVPPDLDANFDHDAMAQTVRQAILNACSPPDHPNNAGLDCLRDCLRFLVGASEVELTDEPNKVKFVFDSKETGRKIAFWLTWNDHKMEYSKIEMTLDNESKPSFADEQNIEFDLSQAPIFLVQILGSLNGFKVKSTKDE